MLLTRAPEASKLIAKSHRWQQTAVAAAAIALLGLSTTGAMALSLGRITVMSALGEPLRAEIDVPDINAEEAASLKASVAGPDAFVAAGLEFNPAMSSVQTSLKRRADGRAFIALSSDRAINEPFVDMILETSWASGRIVRDYTMLFDPPALRKAAPVPAPTLAQTNAAPASTATPTPTRAPAATAQATPDATPVAAAAESKAPAKAAKAAKTDKPAKVVKQTPSVAPTPRAADVPAAPVDSASQVTIKSGDTASKIASRTKAAGVSLDQMLVALLRANPDAFVRENVNRIRSGAVMTIPTAEQAQSVSAAEATQTVVAHSKDFNAYRRGLASNAPTAEVGTAARKASGAVQAQVEDKKPAAATPDKLTLSKGAVQSKANEDKIAKERAKKDAADRAAEIAKNTAELEKIRKASAASAAAEAAKAAAAAAAESKKAAAAPSGVTVAPIATPAPAITAPIEATAPAAVASVPEVAASEPVDAASTPVVTAAPAAPMVAPISNPYEEPSLVEELLENAWIPAAAGGLLALLGGFAFWRMRQRKKNASQMDSSFLESRLQPDSFFGASGGQRVDTNSEMSGTGSSMVYSASQLDAADDVDPVAEADVYLAYGRDLQAEEILKEAARINPGRLAIHTKLLEIFAKRRDTKNFETTAAQAFKLTGNNNPDWIRICGIGLDLDPTNPLYQPGGEPTDGENFGSESNSSSFGSSTIPVSVHANIDEPSTSSDLDLDLDFSIDDEPVSAISDVTGEQIQPEPMDQTVTMPAADSDNNLHGMDFDLPEEAPAPVAEFAELPEISTSMDGVNLLADEPAPVASYAATDTMPLDASAPAATQSDMGMLEFDMNSLSLDLETPAAQPIEQPAEVPEFDTADPLETKLALADEFVSIGDDDGARALIEEVISEASGDVLAKARKALANLN
jgi:pilus assembly protein FimV